MVASAGETGVYLESNYWEYMDYRTFFKHCRLAQHPRVGIPSSNGPVREGGNR